MSKYSTELRYVCESMANLTESVGNNQVDTVIASARPKIFNFQYDLYDNSHKEELETKIIAHYYFQEIGFETFGLWHYYFKRRFLEVLPYYNELYRSADFEYNPLYDVDYVKTHEGSDTRDGTTNTTNASEGSSQRTVSSSEDSESNSTTTRNSTDWNLYSDTPQGSISRIDVNGDNYLTNATKDTSTGSETFAGTAEREVSTTESNTFEDERNINSVSSREGTNEYTETMRGKVGTYSYAKMIKEYRDNIINIDLKFIREFEYLFMQLW